MKKLCLIIGVLLFALVSHQNGLAWDQFRVKSPSLSEQDYVPDELIVKFKPGVNERIIKELNQRYGTTEIGKSRVGHHFRKFKAQKKNLKKIIERYNIDPNVEYAEPNYIAYAFWQPDDGFYQYQWHMDNPEYGGINIEDAWDIETGDNGIVVAVLDTGVAYEDYSERIRWRTYRYYLAPDLEATSFVDGYDFVNNDTHPNDDEGHGTHVTGTIAQSTNNGIGVAGVAFNSSIMPVKVLNRNGSGTYADIADGIGWAADNGANIINLSLGGSNNSITLKNALAYAYEKGVTIICSSGNDGSPDTISYPAAYDEYCIAVGATRYDETVAYYSNGGPSLDLVAPGGDFNVDQNGDGYPDGILQQTFGNTTNDWGYWFYQGTSMAAPHVSGVAALILAQGIAAGPDEVREVLQTTAEDKGPAGWDPVYGHGIVDAYAALNYSPTPNNFPVADAGGPYSATEDVEITFDGSGSYDPDGDALTYSWDFGDGSTGSGKNPVHTYTAGGTYTVTLVVNDGRVNSEPAFATAEIIEVNDPPTADAGGPYYGTKGDTITFDGSGSYDPDGDALTYSWDFGDGSIGNGMNPVHTYTDAGTYTVTLTVTDDGGLTDTAIAEITINEASAVVEVFFDSFEASEWNGLWTEDNQNDWFRSRQRAVDGGYSAEIDGRASDATLTSVPINLQGKTNVMITFSWFIERGLDRGEYLAFDVSIDGGGSWSEMTSLNGNVDPENQWFEESLEVKGIDSLRIRFRGKMSSSNEDANVDLVRITAW